MAEIPLSGFRVVVLAAAQEHAREKPAWAHLLRELWTIAVLAGAESQWSPYGPVSNPFSNFRMSCSRAGEALTPGAARELLYGPLRAPSEWRDDRAVPWELLPPDTKLRIAQ